ncbi:MAG: PDC sensor domain-containing protein, partial [Eubacterium sp.]|nr:PDC sensor domain-containing protein [Eubacterium sp.]
MKSISVKVRKTVMTSLIIVIALFTVIAVFFMYIQKETFVELNDESSEEIENFTDNVLYENITKYSKDLTAACGYIIEDNFEHYSGKGDSVAEYIFKLYENDSDETQAANLKGAGYIGGISREKTEELYKIGSVRDYIKAVPGYDSGNLGTLDIFVVTEKGLVLDGTDNYLGDNYSDLRQEDWYISVKETMEPVWTGVTIGAVTGQEKISYLAPLVYENEFKGVVGVSTTLMEIYNTLLNINFEEIEDIVLTDSKGEKIIGGDEYDVFEVQSSDDVIFEEDCCLSKYDVAAADYSVYFIFDISDILSGVDLSQSEINDVSFTVDVISMCFIVIASFIYICIAAASVFLAVI